MPSIAFSGISTKPGELEFHVPSVLSKHNRAGLLKSIDFPYSQRTIESSWNKLHYMESIRITPESRSVSVLLTDKESGDRVEMLAMVPLTTNKIIEISTATTDGTIILVTEEPHGFFAPGCFGKEVRNVISSYKSIFPHGTPPFILIHGSNGSVQVDPALFEYNDEYSVKIKYTAIRTEFKLFGKGDHGWMVTPEFPTISMLCQVITNAMNSAIIFNHDDPAARTRMYPGTCSNTHVIESVSGDSLAKALLGYDGVYAGWEEITIPAGMYCYGELDLSKMIAAKMNRWHIDRESSIIFRGVSGYTWNVTLPSGNYGTPEKLAHCIQHMMNMTAKNRKNPYCVRFTLNEGSSHRGKFVFVAAEPFDLLFGDDESIDPSILGFEPVDHIGRNSYMSENDLGAPLMKPNCNVYDVDEIPGTHQIRIGRRTRLAVDGKIRGYSGGTLRLNTVNRTTGAPECHGMNKGDVVTLTTVMPAPDGATGTKREGFTFRAKNKIMGVVVADENENPDASSLHVSVPSMSWTLGIGSYITIDSQAAPISVALFDPGKNQFFRDSIGASRLGFSNGVSTGQHGVVVSQCAVNLEPRTVDVSFIEGSMTSASTEMYNQNGKSLITQIPSDRSNGPAPQGMVRFNNALQQFKLEFTNPDGSPYHFNHASLSLLMEFDD